MPIKSFIVFPSSGSKEQLIKELLKIEECTIIPSDNKEILVLVTDTKTEEAEETLLKLINSWTTVDQLSIVAGYNESQILTPN